MIGSFWNLCRACPSMPLDKLHSEYRSTYRWHEYTGNSRPEVVVRRPPVANASNGDNFFSRSTDEEKQGGEPPLPRRKKCPELAYRAHEFIGASGDVTDSRARSGDRGAPGGRRSKSAGPPSRAFRDSSPPPPPSRKRVLANGNGPTRDIVGQSTGESGLFRKTISKLSTEYRLQFVWPRMAVSEVDHASLSKATAAAAAAASASNGGVIVDSPKKSKSMGALKSGGHQLAKSQHLPMVHRKRTTSSKEATQNELEPLFAGDEKIDSLEQKMGHKKMFNGPEVNQRRSDKQNFGFVANGGVGVAQRNGNSAASISSAWYKDVIELRKKAGEYKCRGWGAEIDPDYHRKQKELWDQVSRRSSLSALALAATAVRPISKEQKEKENSKKSSASPTKGLHADAAATAALKLRKEAVRHHLDRTTGSMVEDGALLPSPTIDKLMPALPRSREGSPKKTIASRHGSPQKGSPKKLPKMAHKGRSQSVGTTTNHVADATATNGTTTSGSPKRQLRSAVTIDEADVKEGGVKPVKDTKVTIHVPGERRPRPTTLSTTPKTATRSKSSSLPPSSTTTALRAQSVPAPQSSSSSSASKQPRDASGASSSSRPKSYIGINRPPVDPMMQSIFVPNAKGPKWSSPSKANDAADVDGNGHQQTTIPEALLEPLIKSPPEPTRVKSPEQLLMRSPDPVNWTVPLDTGKTFTVTQNIREGDVRPHSEMKVCTPLVDHMPLPSASAPPELAEQAKLDAYNRPKSNPTDVTKIVQPLSPKKTLTNAAAAAQASSLSVTPVGVVAQEKEKEKEKEKAEVRFDKPVPGSTLRCLEDPIFTESLPAAPVKVVPVASGSNEIEGRDRFDRFWGGGGKETTVVNGGGDEQKTAN